MHFAKACLERFHMDCVKDCRYVLLSVSKRYEMLF